MRRYSNRNKMSGKILSTLYNLMIFSMAFVFLTLSPIACLISTKFSLILGNIVWEEGGRGLSCNLLETNYNNFVYYLEWRVVDHLVRGGVPITFATHRKNNYQFIRKEKH